ncbi:MAG: DUF1624 domain-containing protein [Candidatus Diapherotrites archaeon]|nr:DUF1624 domain-containing protein [Candidatus Diapherotrites archaeon]
MPRFLEIDLARGIAVLCMIVYHFLFDWNFFVQSIPGFYAGFWFYFARATAAVFVGLAGVSITLHANKQRANGRGWRGIAVRGTFIFLLGMTITAFTFLAFPSRTIFFGILHLIGTSIVLSIPFLFRPRLTLALGLLVTGSGILFYPPFMQGLLPFVPVVLPVHVQSFDYVPLIPWFGVFLLGMSIGHAFYPLGKPVNGLGWQKGNGFVQFLAFVGRKSLPIYLAHQPLIVSILIVLGFIDIARVLG